MEIESLLEILERHHRDNAIQSQDMTKQLDKISDQLGRISKVLERVERETIGRH